MSTCCHHTESSVNDVDMAGSCRADLWVLRTITIYIALVLLKPYTLEALSSDLRVVLISSVIH